MAAPEVSYDPLQNVVLQCRSCKTIVGDTHSFACVYRLGGSEFVVIKAATEITVDRIPQTTQIEGQKCTHFHVCCSGCGTVLGRMYTTPPETLGAARDAFSFDAAKCSSYRLGSAEVRVAGQDGQEEPRSMEQGQAPGIEPSNAQVEHMQAKFEALEVEMLKMQGMILLHDMQLQSLPGYDETRQSMPGEGPASTGQPQLQLT